MISDCAQWGVLPRQNVGPHPLWAINGYRTMGNLSPSITAFWVLLLWKLSGTLKSFA